MSSQIDPEPVAPPPVPPPTARKATVQPPVAPPRRSTPAADEDASSSNAPADSTVATSAIRQAPAWAVSMLVHVVVLLAMALIVSTPPKRPVSRVITSDQKNEDDLSEVDASLPQDPSDVANPSMDAMLDAAIEVSETPVDVATLADDLDAAPLAVELTDFGTDTAPASDMMATMGAVGGTGGGLGGRSQAAKLAAAGGGGADTEQAVDRALKWLVAHQLPDGGWSFDLTQAPSCMGRCSHSGVSRATDRSGATSMALLPFLARGYTHKDGPYKQTVEKGIAFLAQMAVNGKGRAYEGRGDMYSQGLAGITLSECYAMSQDSRLAAPTQLVLNYIMEAQDPIGGGWRYRPRQPGDTSVVGWQIMALKSGNMARLHVNPLTVKKAVEFLDSVESKEGAAYGYLDNSTSRPSLNAVGLLCRMYLGWKKENPALLAGIDAIAKRGPTKDLYYDYYATQVLHHVEGEEWISWNKKMKELLLPSQSTKDHETGSWFEGFENGHATEAAGRLYCTSMATMILEVYYRHLPIYKTEEVEKEVEFVE